MAAGQAVWVAGDVTYSVYDKVLHVAPFPSLADVLYLGSYPLILTGLAMVVRDRRRAFDVGGVLDAGIVAVGLGLLSWTFLIRPTLADPGSPLTARLVAVGYPAADILILAMLAWLLSTGGARTVSYAFLLTAVVCLLASDIAHSVLTTWFAYHGGITDTGWLLSYVLWAAAWHPSMNRIGETRPVAVASRRRQLTLGVTVLVAPGLLMAQGLAQHGRVDWLAVSTGGVLLCLLSLARYTALVRRLQHQSTKLAGMALRDEVTGLGNRHHLEQQLTDSLTDPGRRTCLVVIDLDDFHQVNDRHGRATGDTLLAAVAERLSQAAPHGTLARIGGDEFGLHLDTAARPGTVVADTAVAQVQRLHGTPFTVAGHTLLVRAHIGLADNLTGHDPPGTVTAAELLRRADVAVDAARRNATMRYHPNLDEYADEQARVGAALRAGLDNGQFEVHYQPIVDLSDGHLVAVEALVRWHHPTLGVVGPDGFIPVAERNGLITGLPAHRLTVEVTETAVFGGGQAVATLWALHDLGIRVALDDFGTGHSSLGLLRDCPVDVLKVDKSFIAALTDGGRDSAIVAGLVAIIDGLGLTVVAEGVEHADQATQLRRLGYHFAQGYLFGRPMPAADLQRILPTYQTRVPRLQPAAA